MRKSSGSSVIYTISWCILLFTIHVEQSNASQKFNRYLAHLFNKYGNGGTMSFEGLEHLMHNLGLGELEFNPTHTIEEHRPNGYSVPDFMNDDDYQNLVQEEAFSSLIGDDDVKYDADITEDITSEKTILSTNMLVKDLTTTSPSNIDIVFKEMHDPKHRHPRHHAEADFSTSTQDSNVCLSPKSLLRLIIDHDDLHKSKLYKNFNLATTSNNNDHNTEEEYNEFINAAKLTPVGFLKLCPALLVQIDQQVCVQPMPMISNADKATFLLNAWIYASGAIFVLSACGLLGILLVPLMKSVAYQEVLKFLVAVAVGTLSGDALMHLIPHALSSEHVSETSEKNGQGAEHSHNRVVWACATAFFTAVFMYILETILPLLKPSNSGHNHSHSPPAASSPSVPSEAKEINIMLDELNKDPKDGSRPLTPVAFMVILGDGLHNLTDGLAIGAAFASDPVTGMATSFAVLCHELPHELGDFALLLQTGISIRRAILLNVVSSVLSFIGMAIGLLIGGLNSNMTQFIYAGTAGSFLYIAFADLIPAMNAESQNDFKSSIIQIVGMLVGGFIMVAIALNEDSLADLFK